MPQQLLLRGGVSHPGAEKPGGTITAIRGSGGAGDGVQMSRAIQRHCIPTPWDPKVGDDSGGPQLLGQAVEPPGAPLPLALVQSCPCPLGIQGIGSFKLRTLFVDSLVDSCARRQKVHISYVSM